ncbi:MAG: MMPL family transporter, partial [Mycobacterium sp.]
MAEGERGRRLSRGYAALVIRLRWLILFGIGAAVWLATMYLPALRTDVGLQISDDSATVHSVQEVLDQFGLPLLSRAAVVQRDPDGLSTAALDSTVRHAARVNLDTINNGMPATGIAGALPVPNVLSAPGRPTTIVTYLWGGSTLNSGELVDAAQTYADHLGPEADVVGVTGVVPVQVEQGRLVQERLKWVEIGSLAAVALILAITFRSVVAPLVTLATAVVAYLLAVRVIGAASTDIGVIAPSQIQPLIVALTLGLATDYSIFFLAGMRRRVLLGCSPRAALRASVTHNAPIVLVAGLTVAAGVASVSVAKLSLFRVFGPGLAIMVLIALLVSMTLVPAMLAISGRLALW